MYSPTLPEEPSSDPESLHSNDRGNVTLEQTTATLESPFSPRRESSPFGSPPQSPYEPHFNDAAPSPLASPIASPGGSRAALPPPTNIAYLPGENPALFELPEGCKEQPHIRLAYLGAIASSVVDRSGRRAVEASLSVSLGGYTLLGALPTRPKPVTTLPSVRRRLGLDIDDYMSRKPLCSVCYKIYNFEDINTTAKPDCTRPDCHGAYWELSSDDTMRKPIRVIAYGGVIASLRRMFMRPEFVALLHSGAEAHMSHGSNEMLHDVCDGAAWGDGKFGLERVFAGGVVQDRPLSLPALSLGFGLFASVNLDWFRITHSTSVGGLYLSILNLHRSARNLPWNVILACAIPGPGEPSLEDLNNVLEPVVEEFKTLYAGESQLLILLLLYLCRLS